MKLSKVFLVLGLVMGLVFITASAKASTWTYANDTYVSNGAISYFQTNDSLSTVICVFNTDSNKDRDITIHLIVFNEKSQHVVDRTYTLTHWGTAVFQVSLTAEGDYVLIKGVGGEVKDIELYAPVGTADHEVHDLGGGVYGGYIQIVEVASESDVVTPAYIETDDPPNGCDDAEITYDLAVTTALIGPDWWVGLVPYWVAIDECSGDLLNISELEGAIRAIDYADPSNKVYGRWWDSDTVNSTLVLIDPARYDKDTTDPTDAKYGPDYGYKQKTMAYLYDEAQNRIRSFSIEAPEVYRSSSPFDGTSEESGWIEIDNVTATTYGFIIVEEAGKCDMLPLFKTP